MPQFHKETAKTAELQGVTNTVEKCARCGGYHQDLQFRPFSAGPMRTPGGEVFAYWALCPANGEPMLGKGMEANG